MSVAEARTSTSRARVAATVARAGSCRNACTFCGDVTGAAEFAVGTEGGLIAIFATRTSTVTCDASAKTDATRT